MLYLWAAKTDRGWVGMEASPRGLLRLTFPLPFRNRALDALGNHIDAYYEPAPFSNLPQRLAEYYSGEVVDFPDAVDWDGATPFQRRVWKATRAIPYGEVRSYSWLAQAIGKPGASRAVGQALAANPVPVVIPCHRVVGKDGGLTGFGGGLELKRALLELEGRSILPGRP